MTENIKNIETSIGLIPSDWKVEKLGSLGKLNGGGTPSTSNLSFWSGNIPWISSSDLDESSIYEIKENRFITDEAIEKSATKLIPKNSILIVSRVGVGKVAINNKDICTSQDFTNLTLKEDNYHYFAYLIKLKINKLLEFNQGTSIKGFVKSDLEALLLPVPPIGEQQKIASILSTWDAAIDNCKWVIDNLKNRNVGLAQQLLSGKMRLKDFQKSQWHLKSVEEVAVFKNGKAHENCIDEEGNYFVVNSKFISTQGKVSKASNENLCPLFKNDITLVMSDIPNGKALAKCFYIPEDDKYTLNQRICALTAKKGTDSKFLYYQMNRNNYYLSFNNGVSQTNLKKEEVLECPLLIPDIQEQIQIVKVIDTANEELNQYQQKLQTLQLQKKGLVQQLLTGKVRVKI